jgi:hypothetical protein
MTIETTLRDPHGASWAAFEAADPALAAAGRVLFYQDGSGKALLATVDGDAPPRIHPIWPAIVDGRLLAFINRSAKQRDIERDGRYALHSMMGAADIDEFSVRGRVRVISDPVDRAAVAAGWAFQPGENYTLVEFTIASALLGRRTDADDWPPKYAAWTAESPA